MQKKLLALAIASLVSAPVFAQSQVTLYGTFDAGIRNVDNVNGAGDSKLAMDNAGNYNSNRWGMRGSEDLGNGMKANFNLEGGFMSGSGTIDKADGTTGVASTPLFQRKAIVGLSGNWGALDLGRNYTTIFYTTGAYDPFNYKYTGIIPIAGLDGARDNNTITYTSNSMNGLVFRANHSLGEVAGKTSGGTDTELGLSYANGPFSVGGAYGQEKDATNTLTTKNWTIGGAYTTGPWRVALGYDIKKADLAAGGTGDTKNAWLGGSYKMSAANALTAAYYDTKTTNVLATEGKKKLFIVGFVHNLSKRTELYADIDYAKLSGSSVLTMPAPDTRTQDNATGISVGINHAF